MCFNGISTPSSSRPLLSSIARQQRHLDAFQFETANLPAIEAPRGQSQRHLDAFRFETHRVEAFHRFGRLGPNGISTPSSSRRAMLRVLPPI